MEAVKLSIADVYSKQINILYKSIQNVNSRMTSAAWVLSDYYDEFALVAIVRLRAALLKMRRSAPAAACILAILVLTIVPAHAIYELSLYAGDNDIYESVISSNTVQIPGNEERHFHIAGILDSSAVPDFQPDNINTTPDDSISPMQPFELTAINAVIEDDDTTDDEIDDNVPDEIEGEELPLDPTASTGVFIWPAEGDVVSGFGPRNIRIGSRNHKGIDIDAPNRAPIYAADGGEVTDSRYSESFGHVIKILHDNGHVTLYAHCSTRLVKIGERVEQGQVIARVGMTGIATGYHLHFELIINGKQVDPIPYLPQPAAEEEESGTEKPAFFLYERENLKNHGQIMQQ